MKLSENIEVTIMELENTVGKLYKVSKRVPEFGVSETKVFRLKEDALRQMEFWLQ